MKKNIFLKILFAIFAVSMCLNFSSCNKDDDDDEKKEEKKEKVTTGTIHVTNATDDTYKVTIEGEYRMVSKNHSLERRNLSVGYYNVFVEQQDGYILYPSKYTYNVYVTAGEISYVTIK